MSQPVYTTDIAQDIITQIIAATTGVLDGATIHLFKADFEPSKTTVPADFTEADYDGYASIAAVWEAVTVKGQQARTATQLAHFQATGSVTQNTIYGFWIQDSGGTKVITAQRFDTEKQMVDATSFVDVQGGLLL